MISRDEVIKIKSMYTPGTRVRLTADMDDPYCSIHAGSEGVVNFVDDAANIHMKWDNGSTLALIPDVDYFERI